MVADQVGSSVSSTSQQVAADARAVLETWQFQQLPNFSAHIGETLPSILKKLIDKIQSGGLYPAKGRTRTLTCKDGQLLLVQVKDINGVKKLIPDFQIWAPSFAIFATVLAVFNLAILPDYLLFRYSHSC